MGSLLSDITIVIPAKNEAATLPEILEKCSKHSSDLLVVDGCSTDGTLDIATKFGSKVIKDNGKGKGDAIRCAIPHLTNGITVFIDADGSHDPDDISKLIEPIQRGEADHVSGSRLIGGSSELHGGFDECFRLMGSSLITACINWKFGVVLSESQNGFRAIKTEVLKKLDLQENKTTIEQEMIFKTLSKGFRMAEVPTHEYKRKAGESKIVLTRHWFRYVWTLVKFLMLPKRQQFSLEGERDA